jgi:hypothetical protein
MLIDFVPAVAADDQMNEADHPVETWLATCNRDEREKIYNM